MRAIVRALLFIAVLCAAASNTRAQTATRENKPPTASISGRVTVNGKPAPNAAVIVTAESSGLHAGNIVFDVMPDAFYAKTLTDADGRYQLMGLAAGRYQVRALSRAFIAAGNANSTESVKPLTLDDGEAREGVDFALVRGGAITGRVTGADGKPVIEEAVQLTLVDERGEKKPFSGELEQESLMTDDRGVYRIYGLPAGRYLASVGGNESRVGVSVGGDAAITAASRDGQSRTYHPGTTDEAQATIIEVKEGGEVTNVDIRLGHASKSKTFAAAGRVIEAETGKAMPNVSIMCFSMGGQDRSPGLGAQGRSDGQGAFRLSGLAPGRYAAFIFTMAPFEQSEYYGDQAVFEIVDGDVSGVEIKLHRGGSISGVAVIEGASDPAVRAKLSQLMVHAQAVQSFDAQSKQEGEQLSDFNFSFSRIGADGGFRLTGVRPGRMRLQVAGIERGFAILRVERDSIEVKDGIEVGPGEHITGVRLIIGHGSGVIRGQVKVVGGALPAGSRLNVLAMRTDVETISGGHSFAEVDDRGRFVLEGLMTGEYELTLTVMPSLPLASGQTPESLLQTVKQRVSVTSGAEAQVTLTLDLSAKKQEDRR